MAEHKKRWIQFAPDDDTYESAIKYFNTRIFIKEDMIIIQDPRRLRQKAYALWKYRTKSVDATPGVKNQSSCETCTQRGLS